MTCIIPAIDIIDGKCVRLSQGAYDSKKVYHDKPAEIAKRFADAGLIRLHVVDLDGAKKGKIVNYRALEQICEGTSLLVDFGGGIGSDDDTRIAFECGTHQLSIGSVAVKKRELFLSWLSRYGADKIILCADTRDNRIAVSGWLENTHEDISSFLAQNIKDGVKEVLCTEISRDGLLQGPALDLYSRLRDEFPDLKLIASGGVADISDVEALIALGIDGIVIGKAIYEGRISLNDLRRLVVHSA